MSDTRQDTSPYSKRPRLPPSSDPEPADELGFDRPLLLEPFSPEEVTSVPTPTGYEHWVESSKHLDDRQDRQDQTPPGPTRQLKVTPGSEPCPLPALSASALQPPAEEQTPTNPPEPDTSLLFPVVEGDSEDLALAATIRPPHGVPDTTAAVPVPRGVPWLSLLSLLIPILVLLAVILAIVLS